MTPRRFLTLWLPVFVWCGLIFFLSHQPNLRITDEWWDLILRKIAHLTEYAILARLLVRAFGRSTSWPAKKIVVWTFVLCFLYACSDEFHQNFVEGRKGSVLDVLIDTAGAWLALKIL